MARPPNSDRSAGHSSTRGGTRTRTLLPGPGPKPAPRCHDACWPVPDSPADQPLRCCPSPARADPYRPVGNRSVAVWVADPSRWEAGAIVCPSRPPTASSATPGARPVASALSSKRDNDGITARHSWRPGRSGQLLIRPAVTPVLLDVRPEPVADGGQCGVARVAGSRVTLDAVVAAFRAGSDC
jgi:hypothetical protein